MRRQHPTFARGVTETDTDGVSLREQYESVEHEAGRFHTLISEWPSADLQELPAM